MGRPLGSLRARVFAASTLVAVLPMAAAVVFVSRGVTWQAESELEGRVDEAARLVEQFHRARLELAVERATLIADLPKLKAAVAEADPRTVEPVARDYRRRVHSDVFVVADRGGRPLVVLGAAAWQPGASRYRVEGGRLLETVDVPILLGSEPPPELLGHLTLGFALDESFAARLGALTGARVAIVHAGRVFGSTLPRSLDRELARHAQRRGRRLGLAGEDYVAARVVLGAGQDDASPQALVLRSRAEVLRPLSALRGAVVLAALGAIAASVLLSFAVARTVTRPLSALTATMREIAATGDLGRPVAPPQPLDDEDAQLLTQALGTLTASIARFQREAALGERLSALGRLSTVIAHEVRNPLMIIKGSLRTLERDDATRAEVREVGADVAQQVERLNRLVGDVLDFARPLKLQPGVVEPATLVQEALRAVLDAESAIAGRAAVDPRTGSLVTDGDRLRAVLVNLIENARDSVASVRRTSPAEASPGDGAAAREPPDVEAGACRLESGQVRFWVQDRGAGIPAADLAHVFEPYFTTKRTGTGLGLAIARKTVEALGGTIRLHSREPAGTRVEIDLPPELIRPATEAT